MVLPLLAAAGGMLAAGSLGKVLKDEWSEGRERRREGERMSEVLDHLGPNAGPDQAAAALGRAGMLSTDAGRNYLQGGFQDYGSNRDFQEQLQLADHNAGLQGDARQDAAAIARQQFLFQQEQLKQVEDQRRAVANQNWQEVGGNPNLPEQYRAGAYNQLAASEAQRLGWTAPEPVYEGGLSYSPAPAIATALQGVESGGEEDPWTAQGPELTGGRYEGQRAFGPLQVMPGNVPEWSRRYADREWSADEMREGMAAGDPAAREAYTQMTQGRIEALRKEGRSDQDIMSIWHSGRPLAGNQAVDRETRLRTQDFVKRGSALLGQGAAQDQRSAATQLAELDAGAAYGDKLDAIDGVLSGLKELPRVQYGSELWNRSENQAIAKQVEKDATELLYQWQGEVYGDREPPPAVQERIAEVFGEVGGMLTDREKTASLFRLMRAETERKQEYDMLRARAENGDRGALQALRDLNGGQLTRAERMTYLRGDDVPGELVPGEAPEGEEAAAAAARAASPGRGGRR